MWQQIIVLLVFAGALGYLGYRSWLAFKRPASGGCAKGCGCETPAQHAAGTRKANA